MLHFVLLFQDFPCFRINGYFPVSWFRFDVADGYIIGEAVFTVFCGRCFQLGFVFVCNVAARDGFR